MAADYGVLASWIYELLARYRSEGEAALNRGPGDPQPADGDPGSHCRADHQAAPGADPAGVGCRLHTIAWHLAEQHQLTVSEATIWRTLSRAGLITPEPKKKPKAAYICFAAEQPNEMWQVDFTHYRLTRPDGTPGADARFCASSTTTPATPSPSPATNSHRACSRGGVPANRR